VLSGGGVKMDGCDHFVSGLRTGSTLSGGAYSIH
jgi:hypothetical protein